MREKSKRRETKKKIIINKIKITQTNVTSDSYFESETYRYSHRHSIQRFWATSQPRRVCRYGFLSTLDRALQHARARAHGTTSPSTSRTHAVMATSCRIRERLDQRSERVEKIVWRKPSENSPAICEARCNWNSRVSVFHRQKCGRGPRGNVILISLVWNTPLLAPVLSLSLFASYLPGAIDIFRIIINMSARFVHRFAWYRRLKIFVRTFDL